jgi:uncharacterized membrane protein
VWPFNRELTKRKGKPFYWLYLGISLICIAALVVVFAVSGRIAAALPQATWLVVVFVSIALAIIIWLGRNGPEMRWVHRRWSQIRAARRRQRP